MKIFYPIIRGELALVACKNGQRTADTIKSHLESICNKRNEAINSMNQSELEKDPNYNYFMRQKQLIEDVERSGIKIVETDVSDFNDGEIKPRIHDSITGKDIYVIQNSLNPRDSSKTSHNLMETFLTIDAVKRSDAAHTSLILPYMSYSKQDRITGREPGSAKVLIDLLDDSGAEIMFTMDLHSPAIPLFSSAKKMRIKNLYASSILLNYFLEEKKFDGVWVAPDPGAGKMVKHYSKVSGLSLALGYKHREPESFHKADEQRLLGDVKGKDIAIIDDQSAGSGTLINMAKIAKQNGANKVYGGVTHLMMLKDAETQFKQAVKNGYLDGVVATNTLMQPPEFLSRNPYITTLDALQMFAVAIFETHVSGSISQLYDSKLREAMFGEHHKSIMG